MTAFPRPLFFFFFLITRDIAAETSVVATTATVGVRTAIERCGQQSIGDVASFCSAFSGDALTQFRRQANPSLEYYARHNNYVDVRNMHARVAHLKKKKKKKQDGVARLVRCIVL
jgi:hypothetical protein